MQETVDHLYVNGTRTNKLKVDFDISFHEIPCNLLSVDAMDDTGMPQKDAIHEIYKHKLSPEGEKQGFPERSELGNTVRSEADLEELVKSQQNAAQQQAVMKQKIGDCGNCYGAGLPGQCCQTCTDVKAAYQRVGWRFKPHGIMQCTSEAFLNNMKEQFAEDGGCQLYGSLELNRGTGHFHIAPHKKLHQPSAEGGKLVQGGQPAGLFNLMDLISFTFDQFNVSHTINTLSFGDNFPGIKSPLDGEKRSVVDTHGMYQYYVKVVPTRYKVRPKVLSLPAVRASLTSAYHNAFCSVAGPVQHDGDPEQPVLGDGAHVAPGAGLGARAAGRVLPLRGVAHPGALRGEARRRHGLHHLLLRHRGRRLLRDGPR